MVTDCSNKASLWCGLGGDFGAQPQNETPPLVEVANVFMCF